MKRVKTGDAQNEGALWRQEKVPLSPHLEGLGGAKTASLLFSSSEPVACSLLEEESVGHCWQAQSTLSLIALLKQSNTGFLGPRMTQGAAQGPKTSACQT